MEEVYLISTRNQYEKDQFEKIFDHWGVDARRKVTYGWYGNTGKRWTYVMRAAKETIDNIRHDISELSKPQIFRDATSYLRIV